MSFAFKLVMKTFLAVFALVLFLSSLVGVYFLGMVNGYKLASEDAEVEISMLVDEFIKQQELLPKPILPSSTPRPTYTPPTKAPTKVSWGGPELWEAVNKRRQEFGVNPLSQKNELCTIASIRLNELLDLGDLDNHAGFTRLQEEREDVQAIFNNYSTVAEFLALGGQTPEETVSMWENTLGHRLLLTGGEYVWGCIYAQNTYAVAISAF
jgi:uncharacterized protein YkwD